MKTNIVTIQKQYALELKAEVKILQEEELEYNLRIPVFKEKKRKIFYHHEQM